MGKHQTPQQELTSELVAFMIGRGMKKAAIAKIAGMRPAMFTRRLSNGDWSVNECRALKALYTHFEGAPTGYSRPVVDRVDRDREALRREIIGNTPLGY